MSKQKENQKKKKKEKELYTEKIYNVQTGVWILQLLFGYEPIFNALKPVWALRNVNNFRRKSKIGFGEGAEGHLHRSCGISKCALRSFLDFLSIVGGGGAFITGRPELQKNCGIEPIGQQLGGEISLTPELWFMSSTLWYLDFTRYFPKIQGPLMTSPVPLCFRNGIWPSLKRDFWAKTLFCQPSNGSTQLINPSCVAF